MSTEISPLKATLRVAARRLAHITRARHPMQFPTYSATVTHRIEQYHDDVRYATLALAIERLQTDQTPGAFAEIGVYRGVTSSFIHRQAPDRRFYLAFRRSPSMRGRTLASEIPRRREWPR